MRTTRLVSLTASVVLLAGCFGVSLAEAQQQSEPVTIPVDFYNVRGEKLPPDARPRELAYTLAIQPGKLGGGTVKPFLKVHFGREGSSIRLNLDDLSERVNKQAAKLVADPWIHLAPEGTRFASIWIGATFWVPWTKAVKVGFLDAETGNVLRLLYVDRPCHFTGTFHRGARTTDYDVRAESAGFVWVETRHDGADHLIISLALAPHPVLTINPPYGKYPTP